MSIIAKSLSRFNMQAPPATNGFLRKWPGRLRLYLAYHAYRLRLCLAYRASRLRLCLAACAGRPASCVGGIATRFCDAVFQCTSARKYPASRYAYVFAGVLMISVTASLFRPASQIEAGIASVNKTVEGGPSRAGTPPSVYQAPDDNDGRTSAITIATAAKTETNTIRPSNPDLALPLSRHVLKFIPPQANQNRTAAISRQPSVDLNTDQPKKDKQPADAVAAGYMANPSKSQPEADIGIIQNAPPVQDPLIKLAAIACFDNRERCTAVINGRALRLGQTISGYLLVQIGESEVIMQKNGQLWSLRMK